MSRREIIEQEAAQRDADRRAKLYVKLQREQARQASQNRSNGMIEASTGRSRRAISVGKLSASCKRWTQFSLRPAGSCQDAPVKLKDGFERKDTPQQHIQARHQQVEKEAKEIVEDALLQQGLDVYRFVEGSN